MKILLLFLSATLILSSCLKDKTTDQGNVVPSACVDTIFFQDEIMGEIMDVSCNTAGCHDNGTAQSGYVIENYAQVSANADFFLNVMNHSAGSPMPYGGDKLADSLIQKFECWIEQGKLNN